MRRLFTNVLGCAVAAFALLGVACTQEPEEKLPTPNFPAVVNAEVTAGEVYTLAIEPNQAWTISIPEESTYFTILDNENEVYSISGEQGSFEIKIKVAEFSDFNSDQVCDVTMKMGQSTQTIATLTVGKLTRSIEIYEVKLEDNEWLYGSETQFEYVSEQVGEQGITLNWGENGLTMFTHRVKIVSNFTWKVDGTPEWIQPISNNTENITELWIKGNGAYYPAQNSTATLSFLDANDESVGAIATLKVSIPAVNTVFSYNDFDESYQFNHKGEIYSALSSSYYEGNAEGSVTSTNDEMLVYTLSFEPAGFAEGAYFPTINDHDWVNCAIAAWDDKNSDLIQKRDISIGVKTNDDTDREAMIIIVPKAVATAKFEDVNEPYEMIEMAEGGMGSSGKLVAEYEQYLVTAIKQSANPGPISLSNPDVVTTVKMIKVATKGDSDIAYDYSMAQHGYELLYTSKNDSDDATFIFDGTYTSVEYTYFDNESGNLKKMSDNDSWIKVVPYGTAGGFRITMKPTATTNKHYKSESYYNGAYWSYIAFKNGDEVVAAISALYNEGYVLNSEGGSANTDISFSSPQYATDIDGSKLEKLTSGTIYNTVVSNYGEIPVWQLTYIKSAATMSALQGINTSWTYIYHTDSDKEWLTFESGEMATVTMKESGNGKTGILIFTDGNQVPKMALACTLNIAQ